MIPYFQFTIIPLGPIAIQVWGLCVASGIIAAVLIMNRLAKRYFVAPAVLLDMAMWALLVGFLGARIFHILFYHLDYYLAYPWEMVAFWHGGLSSLGGFFGAAAAVWLFVKRRKISGAEFLPLADIASVGLWLGWGLGRVGCFLIHDHPGTLTHFIGAVRYPGGARHDLGLYESILGFILFGFCYFVFPKFVKKQWGLVTAVSWLLYALARFGLDWLRAQDLPVSDARYGGLTPAQWGMLVVMLTLTGWLIYAKFGWRTAREKMTNIE